MKRAAEIFDFSTAITSKWLSDFDQRAALVCVWRVRVSLTDPSARDPLMSLPERDSQVPLRQEAASEGKE